VAQILCAGHFLHIGLRLAASCLGMIRCSIVGEDQSAARYLKATGSPSTAVADVHTYDVRLKQGNWSNGLMNPYRVVIWNINNNNTNKDSVAGR
jgi:hypothetical protein